ADHAGITGQGSQHGAEVEITVGDVEGNQAVVLNAAPVNPHRFTRQKMDGNGVGAEGIDDEQAKAVAAFGQLQPGVAQDDVALSQTGAEVSELLLGNALHGRIDLEEGPVLAGLLVAGQGAGAEADQADALQPVVAL